MDYNTRCREEAKTHEMFAAFLKEDDNWTPTRAQVAIVFRACWRLSLSLSKLMTLGQIMEGCSMDEKATRDALRAYVKAKVLRSRVVQGERLWEIAY